MAVLTPRRVPTAMNTASAEPTASLKSIEKDRRESLTLLRTSSSKPGSKKGISQRCSARILVVSLSIANYMMAKVSQTGAGYQPHIPGADHRDAHCTPLGPLNSLRYIGTCLA